MALRGILLAIWCLAILWGYAFLDPCLSKVYSVQWYATGWVIWVIGLLCILYYKNSQF